MTHRLRRFVSLAGVAALLFMQLAVSAYACPGGMEVVASTPPSSQMADACDEMDGVPTPLCHSHCSDGAQSLGKPQTPGSPIAISAVPVEVLVLVDRPAASFTSLRLRHLARAPEPRASIRNCCFRL